MRYQPVIPDKEKNENRDNSLISQVKEFQLTDDYETYTNIKNKIAEVFSSPKSFMPSPIPEDYTLGLMYRYFIQKRNDVDIIIEIDENQYNSKDIAVTGIDSNLYKFLKLEWKLTGPKHDIYSGTMIVEYGVEDTNMRTVDLNSIEFPKLPKLIRDYIQFAKLI